MTKELIISPENLTVANAFLEFGGVEQASKQLNVKTNLVIDILNKKEVKRYIDAIYLDTGYRNRFKLASILDEQIDMKLLEMEEADMTSKKDIVELIALAHKIRTDEQKMEIDRKKAEMSSVNVNIGVGENAFGKGNYGNLMKSLIEGEAIEVSS